MELKNSGNFVKKVFSSAVVIILPENIWDPIQEIRKVHDKAFLRWMPHINIVYPFYETSYFASKSKEIHEALKSLNPFKVTLSQFGYFTHKDSCTLWLRPDTEHQEIYQIQKILEPLFPELNDYSSDLTAFTPHISVGQFAKNEIEQAINLFQSQWKPLEFMVSEVYLISRQDNDSPFKRNICIPFGGVPLKVLEEPEAFKLKTNSSSDKTKMVFVGNIPFKSTENDVKQLLIQNSLRCVSVNILQGPKGPRGFGFAEFASKEDVSRALAMDNQLNLGGRNLTIRPPSQSST